MKERNSDVQSVERAVRLLEVLRDHPDPMSVADLAKALDLSPSTVHRLVNTLKNCKLVDQDPADRRYRLSLRILLFAKAILDRFDLRERAHPFLGELSKEVGETVFMGILDGFELVYVDHVDSLDHGLRMTPQIGRRQDAHTTALGKVLLAHLPAHQLEVFLASGPFPRRTENSITDPHVLRGELEAVRQRGYALDRQESEIGICCVAVPLRGPSGQVEAAISVSGPSTRMDRNGLESRLRSSLQATAARISRAIGA